MQERQINPSKYILYSKFWLEEEIHRVVNTMWLFSWDSRLEGKSFVSRHGGFFDKNEVEPNKTHNSVGKAILIFSARK